MGQARGKGTEEYTHTRQQRGIILINALLLAHSKHLRILL